MVKAPDTRGAYMIKDPDPRDTYMVKDPDTKGIHGWAGTHRIKGETCTSD